MTEPARGKSVSSGEQAASAGALGLRSETLAEGFAFLVVLTVAQRCVGLLREILFCRYLAPDELGQWALCFGFFLLAAPVIVCGIPGSFGRYVEYYRQRGQLRPFLFRTTAVIGTLATAGITTILLGRRQVAWLLFDDPTRAPLVILLTAALVVMVLFNYLVEIFGALRLARLVYGIQFTASLLFAVFGLGLFVTWQASAATVIVAYALGCFVAALGGLYFLVKAWRGVAPASAALPHASLWSRLMPFAGWLWVTNVLVNLFERADCYMIVHFGGFGHFVAETMVGNYHSSRVVPLLMVSVAGLLSGLILPHLSHSWELGRRRLVGSQLQLIYKLAGMAFMTGAVILLIAAPLFFDVALGGKYNGGLAVLPWTLTYCVWFGLCLIAQNYLWCAERARLVSVCYLGGLSLNIALNFLLLPRFGLLGAVLATACGNALALTAVHLLNQRSGMRVPVSMWLVTALPLSLGFGAGPAAMVLVTTILLAVRTQIVLNNRERRRIRDAVGEYLLRLRAFSARYEQITSQTSEVGG